MLELGTGKHLLYVCNLLELIVSSKIESNSGLQLSGPAWILNIYNH